MKKILFAVIALFAFGFTNAQTEVSGSVKDGSGVPILGTNVLIVGSTEGTTTDFDGNFVLSTNLTGSQTVRFSFIGFTTVEETVNLGSGPVVLE